jgi:hypothetical protein
MNGNSTIQKEINQKEMLTTGIEPVTLALLAPRSTD